ncbi:hypothetical protein AMJ50_00015 [Parcubacteria bacterium DG_74_3]|nr:MAG: hypothetical protein AMJ50_00015 [Parcubacteria bacterium DG_74_3]
MDKKSIVIIVLVLALVVLGVFTYRLYSGANECKVIATDLGTQLQECGAGVTQLQAGLAECMAGVQACQDALIALSQVPACAPYIPTE